MSIIPLLYFTPSHQYLTSGVHILSLSLLLIPTHSPLSILHSLSMFDLTLFFWLLQWVAVYAQKGEDLLSSLLLVLHQQCLLFFGLLITAFIFASSLDAHYYHV